MVTTINYLESSVNKTDEEESTGKTSWIITHVYLVKPFFKSLCYNRNLRSE